MELKSGVLRRCALQYRTFERSGIPVMEQSIGVLSDYADMHDNIDGGSGTYDYPFKIQDYVQRKSCL